MATATALMTAAEFAAMPGTGTGTGTRTELVRGRIVEVPPPGLRHGYLCSRFIRLLGNHVAEHHLGAVISESGVITRRDPDSVRGPDISFYSAAKLPPPDQWGVYLDVPPDLVVEVRSPHDRWAEMVRKAAEYLAAGVLVVLVLDPDPRSATVFGRDQAPQTLGPGDTLTLPDILGDFALRVGDIFE